MATTDDVRLVLYDTSFEENCRTIHHCVDKIMESGGRIAKDYSLKPRVIFHESAAHSLVLSLVQRSSNS